MRKRQFPNPDETADQTALQNQVTQQFVAHMHPPQ